MHVTVKGVSLNPDSEYGNAEKCDENYIRMCFHRK